LNQSLLTAVNSSLDNARLRTVSMGSFYMHDRGKWKHFASGLALVMLIGPASVAMAQEKDAASSNPYWPPEKASPIQLKAHIEKIQKTAYSARQAGFGEAMVTASDRILAANPPDSLRSFANVSLLDGLHYWADAEKNADADQRLADLATKYLNDSDKKVAAAASFYDLEQRVLKSTDATPADISKLLDEVKASLNGRALNAKCIRIANGTVALIDHLDTDQAAAQQFKEFGRLFATSSDSTLARFGNQLKIAKQRGEVKPISLSGDKGN
jgi:hypothetical protein